MHVQGFCMPCIGLFSIVCNLCSDRPGVCCRAGSLLELESGGGLTGLMRRMSGHVMMLPPTPKAFVESPQHPAGVDFGRGSLKPSDTLKQ